MKITISFKDPDAVDYAIESAVEVAVDEMCLPVDESNAVFEIKTGKAREALSKFVEYGEYLRVEFDTEAGTATVLEPK